MRLIPCLFALAILIIRRHAAAAWLQDTVAHPEHWLVVALVTWSVVSIGIVCAVLCAAVLVLNELLPER